VRGLSPCRFLWILVEGLVVPAPPGGVAINVEQELRDLVALGTAEDYSVPDSLVCWLPGLSIVINAVEQVKLGGEERPEIFEALRLIDTRDRTATVSTATSSPSPSTTSCARHAPAG
jgi:hypothetical protein